MRQTAKRALRGIGVLLLLIVCLVALAIAGLIVITPTATLIADPRPGPVLAR